DIEKRTASVPITIEIIFNIVPSKPDMRKFFRTNEYAVLLYRILLAYLFYFIARGLFFLYNQSVLNLDNPFEFFRLAYYGLSFDTTAILYLNLVFILFCILPLFINTRKGYQKFLFYVYFTFTLIGYALNFVDFVYYKYTFTRTTIVVWDLLEHESNGFSMFFRFLVSYWHVYLLFIIVAALWIYLYKKVRVRHIIRPIRKVPYLLSSLIGFVVIGTLIVGGIRGGDFKKSTRPINMLDASKHVKKMEQADLVLNTTFAFIRTFNNNSFKKVDYHISEEEIQFYIKPIKEYHNNPPTKPNIVVVITESMGREYIGAFNKDMGIDNYVSYTPFLD